MSPDGLAEPSPLERLITVVLHNDVARMAEIQELKRRVGNVEALMSDVHKIVTEARGGWKTLLAVGGASAAVGAAVAKVVAYLKGA